ncbi:MAG: TIGR00159 family protein [Verrucomicrobia bacterium]|nr:TIGR00159 family protein [Verrucomicrobiota bacterium]
MEFVKLIIPLIEVGILTVLLNYLLGFFWNTRAMDLIVGFLVILALFALANWLHLPVLQKILLGIVEVLVLAVLIIFQPELRIALSRLSFKGKKFQETSEFDRLLEHLTNSVYRLAERHIGAIIVLENQDSLEEFANRAVMINGDFSSELLESIFVTSTPLHDGAVILRGSTLVAASVILPLADDTSQLAKTMGTRHRAALGIAESTDALSIVVSEESGKVSIAREGMMTRGVKPDRFKGIARSIFSPPSPKRHFSLREWLTR